MRLRFLRRFDWVARKDPKVVHVYPPGVHVVTTRCAKAAIADGAAEEVDDARR